jgi:hypothetical protein
LAVIATDACGSFVVMLIAHSAPLVEVWLSVSVEPLIGLTVQPVWVHPPAAGGAAAGGALGTF